MIRVPLLSDVRRGDAQHHKVFPVVSVFLIQVLNFRHFAPEPANPASRRTPLSAGPTQGVHAKLKVKPKSSAGSGPMASGFSLNGSLRSRSSK